MEKREKFFEPRLNIALALAVFTIAYNILEGLVSVYFGYKDETLALFGFGIDSFIEVISGLGIAHMVWRIRKYPENDSDKFEQTALKITGFAFYILVIGLVISSVNNFFTGHIPETTMWGLIISAVSIVIMFILLYWKKKIGMLLDSEAILADAECTKVCLYMSLVLLFSSGIYELTGIAYMDILGTLGLAYLSFNEGRECFEKVTSNKKQIITP